MRGPEPTHPSPPREPERPREPPRRVPPERKPAAPVAPKRDRVEQASWESFPASDPPSWTGITSG